MIVYICSPYRGDTARNVDYARELMDCVLRHGGAPIAPHLYLPQVLDDNNPTKREQGLQAGLELLGCCDLVYVGERYGISEGMKAEIKRATELGIKIIYTDRTI